jgi:hypothetical protein
MKGGFEPFSNGHPLIGAFQMLIPNCACENRVYSTKELMHIRISFFLFSDYHRVAPKSKTKFSNSGEARLVSVCVLYDLTLAQLVGNVKNFFNKKTLKLSLEGS